MSNLIIDITKPKKEFNDFLELIDNNRIIFSGAFGIGKTYFLKKYFENHNKYLALHLYPTNYSVSNNQDIFELVKYDILYELLKNKPQLEKLQLSFMDKLTFLDIKDTTRILTPFIELIPKLGKSISIVIEPIVKLSETVNEKTKGLKLDEGKLLKEFAQRIEETPGNIYGNDFYTQLIIKLIDRLRQDTGKEILLIVDDLDRIDPEHIFRLLNIFAAHLDFDKQEENKFGLSRVIFCCDIENIRTIYSSKYGSGVDFNGYIDKFYSREIFQFDNTSIVVKAIESILSSIHVADKQKYLNYISSRENYYFGILVILVSSFVKSETINLRTLIRLVEINYTIPMYYVTLGSKRIKNSQLVIFILIEFLAKLYGTKSNVISAINKTTFITDPSNELNVNSGQIKRLIADLIVIADFRGHSFKIESTHEMSFNDYTIHYEVKISRNGIDPVFYGELKDIIYQPTKTSVEFIDYKDLLLTVVDIYYRMGRE